MQRGHVQDDAIIEIGIIPPLGNLFNFLPEIVQLADEVRFGLDLLAKFCSVGCGRGYLSHFLFLCFNPS